MLVRLILLPGNCAAHYEWSSLLSVDNGDVESTGRGVLYHAFQALSTHHLLLAVIVIGCSVAGIAGLALATAGTSKWHLFHRYSPLASIVLFRDKLSLHNRVGNHDQGV